MNVPTRIGRCYGIANETDRYEMLHELGRGAMGVVFLARDTVLGRLVAIKLLRDDLDLTDDAKAELRERMRHEARAVAALSHPNMVTLHDMGENEQVGLYLVFEYIEGRTLRSRLEGGAIAPADVMKIARELGSALTYAHEAGVIHRDIKPGNVMSTPFGHKITDFGVARLPDSTLTHAGAILGTPGYMAPETLSKSEFTARSDQFSFAVTIYELLTGKQPFEGEDAVAIGARVLSDDPAPVAAVNPDFAKADAVLQRAMQKDPDKRYASCVEFSEALINALTWRLSLVPLPPESTLSSSIVPRSTRRAQNMIAAVALLTIVSLLVLGKRNERAQSGASLRQAASAFAQAVASAAPRPQPPRLRATATPPIVKRPAASGVDGSVRSEEDAEADEGE